MSLEYKVSEALSGLRDVMVTKAATMSSRLEQVERLNGIGGPSGNLAELLTRSAGFEKFREGRQTMLSVDVPMAEIKAVARTGAADDPLALPVRTLGVVEDGRRRRFVRDLLNVQSTDSYSVEYPIEDGFTNNAAPQDGEGSPLMESGLTFRATNQAVATIGHWVKASKEVLSDSGTLNAFLGNRLIYGARLAEEDQILNGTGTAGGLSGLLNTGNFTAYNRGQAGDSMVTTVRRALTQVSLADYSPSGIVMNTEDWENVELEAATEQARAGGRLTLWGVPVVATSSIAKGTFLVGDFARGATLFERQQATVELTSNHQADFTEGLVVIRAQMRVSLVVTNAKAMVSGTFTAA